MATPLPLAGLTRWIVHRLVANWWSLAVGANLPASNCGGFGEHNSGSGIYHKGRRSCAHQVLRSSTQRRDPDTKMLIADVPLL